MMVGSRHIVVTLDDLNTLAMMAPSMGLKTLTGEAGAAMDMRGDFDARHAGHVTELRAATQRRLRVEAADTQYERTAVRVTL